MTYSEFTDHQSLVDHYAGAIEVFPSDRVRRVLDIAGLSGQPWLKQS